MLPPAVLPTAMLHTAMLPPAVQHTAMLHTAMLPLAVFPSRDCEGAVLNCR